MLYQNDDFGKDYLPACKDMLGEDWDKHGRQNACL